MSKNRLLEIMTLADKQNWCVKPFCITCGCLQYRCELMKMGSKQVIQDLSELKIEDIQNFPNYLNYLLVAVNNFRFELSGERPKIIDELLKNRSEVCQFKESRDQMKLNNPDYNTKSSHW